jgi:dienelactone hydrolase
MIGAILLVFVVAASGDTGAMLTSPFYEDKQELLVYKDADGTPHGISDADTWTIRRQHILENFQRVTGVLPESSRRVPLDMAVEEETEFPDYVRKKITFAVEAGDRLPAYLLIPKVLNGNASAMLCLHPTSSYGKGMVVGLGDKPNRGYAEELAARGYVTLAPDYPGFGDYLIDVYAMGYASATAKGIWNHMRCVDLLQSLDEVDGDRIGCVGHSLGGHNTLFVGMFDPRIKVMVTSCGFNRFAKYYGGDLTGWSHKGYMPRIAEDHGKEPGRMPFDFPEILGTLAPRAVFINAPINDENFEVSGVRDCVEAAMPVFQLLGATEKLRAVYPECGHDFPPDVREEAYAFIEAALRP